MREFKNIIFLLRELGSNRVLQYFLILLLAFLNCLTELLTVASLAPLLGVLFVDEKSSLFLDFIFEKSGLNTSVFVFGNSYIEITLILFMVLIFTSSAFRLFNLWMQSRFCFIVGSEIENKMFQRALFWEYESHISKNSSELISAITMKSTSVIFELLMPSIAIFTSISMVLIFGLTAILAFPLFAFAAIALLLVSYGIIGFVSNSALKERGRIFSENSSSMQKVLHEATYGIRDVILYKSQRFFVDKFKDFNGSRRIAQAEINFFSGFPRIVLEAIILISFLFLGYYFFTDSPNLVQNSLPIAGAVALSFQKLMPLVQQGYVGWSQLKSGSASVSDIFEILRIPSSDSNEQTAQRCLEKSNEMLDFNEQVSLENVSFKYRGSKSYSLRDINVEFKKGAIVGLVGVTGSGKSTLIDILMGLVEPSSGHLSVDGKVMGGGDRVFWRNSIAHVPQQISVLDDTVIANVAYGVPPQDVNIRKVHDVLEISQLSEFVNGLPFGVGSYMGERGVSISGGQRQRIAVARALYRKANVLVLDEATSALDSATEANIISEILAHSVNTTIIMIAHRISTLSKCDVIHELDKGQIIWSGSFNDYRSKSVMSE